MNDQILKQLRYKIPVDGYAGFQAGAIVNFAQLIDCIKSNPLEVLPFLLEEEFPRIQIIVPSIIHDTDSGIELKLSRLGDHFLYVNVEQDVAVPFEVVLTDPSANSELVKMIYAEERKTEYLAPGSHNFADLVHFIDLKDGNIGHFAVGVTTIVEPEDAKRFMIFTNEDERNEVFVELQSLPSVEDEQGGCGCDACQSAPGLTDGLEETLAPFEGVSYDRLDLAFMKVKERFLKDNPLAGPAFADIETQIKEYINFAK